MGLGSFSEHVAADARLTILKAVAAAPGQALNDTIIHAELDIGGRANGRANRCGTWPTSARSGSPRRVRFGWCRSGNRVSIIWTVAW